jgi:hypothetical protein
VFSITYENRIKPDEGFGDFLRFHQSLPEEILLKFFGLSRQFDQY